MNEKNENIPDPKRIEKELGEFLNKKFGGTVKILSPSLATNEAPITGKGTSSGRKKLVNFNIKPQELIAYLDQYIVKQKRAKSVLATKICTHFNRVKHLETTKHSDVRITGSIKSNILMLGPTGVGKTYIVKLIAKRIGVPFVKADATKFSETGYVGGDVDDLVRDLVKEADDDIELAECGIIYLDEIDKIAASSNLRGADISRTGVQRALLKPMEETDVDLKVPHDPVSMMQELESFQRTGKRSERRVNTSNILFIMSGAFSDLNEIVSRRVTHHAMGFGSSLAKAKTNSDILKQVTAEDLVEFGFESEFIGRLPVRCVLDTLSKDDLFTILTMPNNPVILGKRLDFAAYGIDIVFTPEALDILAQRAFEENTGARGLVSVVENALLEFEEKLPSSTIKRFVVTPGVITDPRAELALILADENRDQLELAFLEAIQETRQALSNHILNNWKSLSLHHGLTLSKERSDLVAQYYCTHVTELGTAIQSIKTYYESIKKVEVDFYHKHDINIVFEEDAIDSLIEQFIKYEITSDDLMAKIYNDFYDGLNLIREKSGTNRFFIPRKALLDQEAFLAELIRKIIS
ncbi:ClpX2 [Desulforapulum autotrophicum HRM2]|uniref:ClpX2 n=1 Tax=Desulforapulum autotrophicum (strain ATCC 43914 / DSM 3382 / VKM B-1955 / HRM2) TaxID=177437 RepID=C0QJ73_DESAH|nr:AAA family ATPase [Desulforapulum autotrophicum]ACN15886.1 ClpX2 [Desulforapulum autotrophicum HRM2]